MSFNMMQRHDQRGPLTAAVGSPYFLTVARRGRDALEPAGIRGVDEGGFDQVSKRRLALDHGVITGVKPLRRTRPGAKKPGFFQKPGFVRYSDCGDHVSRGHLPRRRLAQPNTLMPTRTAQTSTLAGSGT